MAEDKIKEKHAKSHDWIKVQVGISILTVFAVYFSGNLYHLAEIAKVRNLVMTFLSLFCIIFRLRQIKLERDKAVELQTIPKASFELQEKKKREGKYYQFFILGLIVSILFPLLPSNGWPYPVLAVILALFSDTVIGIFTSSLFLFISVTISGADFSVFYLYFVCNAIAIILFQKIDESFKIYIPLFLSELSIVIATTAEVFLMNAGHITIESFIIPVINIFITVLFYLIFLKYYSVHNIHKYMEQYMIVTDQEYVLMVDLKEKSKEAYYRAIHTAYFCDKIAKKIGCDNVLAKAGGYYHNLPDFCENHTEQDYENLLKENKFPPALCELLLDYQKKKIVGKETAVVYLSDAIISSISYIYKKDPKTEIDFPRLIDLVFDKKMKSGIFNQCNLTIADLCTMKEIFKGEILYYDFLR